MKEKSSAAPESAGLPIIETDNLVLGPRTMADFALCLAMDSDPDVLAYIGDLPASFDEYKEYLACRITRSYPAGLGYWSFRAKSDTGQILGGQIQGGQFLGWVSLVPVDDNDPASDVEIGWRVAKHAWGNGYATEAASAMLRHAFRNVGLKRVIATIDPGNDRSFRVAEKTGMVFVGRDEYFGKPCRIYEKTSLEQPGTAAFR